MYITRFFKALWSNLLLLLVIFIVYGALIFYTIKVESSPHQQISLAYEQLDVVFVFDTTNSMEPVIEGLLRTSSRFASKLEEQGGDYQFAMVCFGALEEKSVIREVFTPSSDLEAFQRFLRDTEIYGGGREDQLTAIRFALYYLSYRDVAQKILILITDEPMLGDESAGKALPLDDWDQLINEVRTNGFIAYVVSPNTDYFRAMANDTEGLFFDIEGESDFSDVLITIAEAISASFTR